MPFGHTNATATFLRLISYVVHGHLGHICLAELVEILIFARDFSHHVGRLQIVFDRSAQAGLKLTPSKFRLFRSEKITWDIELQLRRWDVINRKGGRCRIAQHKLVLGSWPAARDLYISTIRNRACHQRREYSKML